MIKKELDNCVDVYAVKRLEALYGVLLSPEQPMLKDPDFLVLRERSLADKVANLVREIRRGISAETTSSKEVFLKYIKGHLVRNGDRELTEILNSPTTKSYQAIEDIKHAIEYPSLETVASDTPQDRRSYMYKHFSNNKMKYGIGLFATGLLYLVSKRFTGESSEDIPVLEFKRNES